MSRRNVWPTNGDELSHDAAASYAAGSAFYNLMHNYALPGLMGILAAGLRSALLGEVSLIWIAHISMDRMFGVSTSGFFFLPSFMAALDAFGADRLLYSVDYPFGSLERGRAFLEKLPVDVETLAKIAHGNADRLLKLVPYSEAVEFGIGRYSWQSRDQQLLQWTRRTIGLQTRRAVNSLASKPARN